MRKKKEREREGEQGVAGNKRLANPPCQFNLASNPGEMLIRTSLPLCSALLHSTPRVSLSLFLSLSSGPVASPESLVARCSATATRVLSRAPRTQRHFIFAQRYRRETGPPTRGNCVQSELRPPFLSSLGYSALFFFSLRYLFRPSTLVIYRGYAADARRNPYRSAG